jgi:hypothetical protein
MPIYAENCSYRLLPPRARQAYTRKKPKAWSRQKSLMTWRPLLTGYFPLMDKYKTPLISMVQRRF